MKARRRRFAIHEIIGAIFGGVGLLVSIAYVTALVEGQEVGSPLYVGPFLLFWLAMSCWMAAPVVFQRPAGIRIRLDGHLYVWRRIAWDDIAEFVVISKTDDLGTGRPILVVELRDGHRVVTGLQGWGTRPVSSWSDGDESHPGFFWQPAPKFEQTVAALRTSLATHRTGDRSSPADG